MMSKDELKMTLEEFFNDRESTGHREEHEWIRERIQAEQDRRKMYQSITRSVITWSLPFILTGLVALVQTGHWPKL